MRERIPFAAAVLGVLIGGATASHARDWDEIFYKACRQECREECGDPAVKDVAACRGKCESNCYQGKTANTTDNLFGAAQPAKVEGDIDNLKHVEAPAPASGEAPNPGDGAGRK